MDCMYCKKKLSKDDIAITKKMLGRKIRQFMCLNCLAEYLNCPEDDLRVKMEEFKEQGCTLFK